MRTRVRARWGRCSPTGGPTAWLTAWLSERGVCLSVELRSHKDSASCAHALWRADSEAPHDPAGRPPVGCPHPKEASRSCRTALRQSPRLPAKPSPRSGSRSSFCTRIRFSPLARREEAGPAEDVDLRPLDRPQAPRRDRRERTNIAESPETQRPT